MLMADNKRSECRADLFELGNGIGEMRIDADGSKQGWYYFISPFQATKPNINSI